MAYIIKDKVALWKSRIDVSEKYHKEKFGDRAKKMVEMYRGKHFPDIIEDYSVVINYCYSIVKAILPQIYYQDPYLYLSPGDDSSGVEDTDIAEKLLNHFWYNMQIKKQMKKIVLDTIIYGYGIGKLGWYTKTIKSNKNTETGAEHTELIAEEYPYFLRTSPLDVIFDISSKDLDLKRWVAARYLLPVSELKKKYPKAKDIKGEYSIVGNDNNLFEKSNMAKEDLERAEVWEILDLVDNKIYLYNDNCDDFLKDEDNPYEIPGGNYKILTFNDIPDNLYPLSDLSQIAQINIEMDKTRSQLLNHRAKSQRKIIYEDGIFASEKDKKAFLSEDDMSAVGVKQGMIDKLKIFDASMVDANLYNIDALHKDDLNNLSGVGWNQRGVEAPVEKTATEAQIIDRNSNLRNSERLDSVTDYCIDVGKGILVMLQDFLTDDVALQVVDNGDKKWKRFNKDNIKGTYNIRVDIGSTVKPNAEEERMKFMEFIQFTKDFVDEEGKPILNIKNAVKILTDKYKFSNEEVNKILNTDKSEDKEKINEGELADFLAQLGGTQPTMGMPPQTTMGYEGMPPDLMPQGGIY